MVDAERAGRKDRVNELATPMREPDRVPPGRPMLEVEWDLLEAEAFGVQSDSLHRILFLVSFLPERNLPAHYPVVMDHMDAIGEVARSTRAPIAVGETRGMAADYKYLLDLKALSLVSSCAPSTMRRPLSRSSLNRFWLTGRDLVADRTP